ncbi:Toluene efflux pump outer membrane protein TtgC precursor [Legionella massiliensis]|uniref:Toluene efflux pump outer membrane protein TtgC n=2 Tax=Legionella massiliensis TaxID=1034943 RepID=A0A078L158_9GAMM|nr:Toluene efflux pump outer membrane protein TtgC precursor [Legionella massiliensis]CEE14690.1 Toluene efflux pump outer membrane protein TtgC precursor [Legionella massiliensis]
MSSCTHHPQAIKVPQKWPVIDKNYRNSEEQLPCLAWWKKFNDPSLNTMVDKALIHNNDLKVAMANIEAAQGELKQVQLNWIPDVTGNAGYSSFPYLGFPGVLLNVVPAYTINIFKQIKEQQRAKHELKITQAMFQGTRLAVISQVSSAYFSYLSQIEQLTLVHNLERDLAKLITISQSMYEGGLYSRTNVELAKTELSLTQAKERVVQQNIVINANALHYLFDENPGALAVNSHFKNLNTNQIVLGALPFNIIENRPDLEQAKQELMAANAGIGIAVSNWLPSINLALARGEIAKVANGGQLGQAIHFNQAIAEIPLLRASAYGQLLKAKGLDKASYYRYTDTLRKVLRDVTNDLSAHDLYSKRLNDISKAERDLRKAYSLDQALYKKGIISHFNLIETKVRLDKLAIEVNQYKLEQLLTIVTLYQDLAAGYNYTVLVR